MNRVTVLLGYLVAALLVAYVLHTVVGNHKNKQPYSFGYSWTTPIDTTNMEFFEGMYVTGTPPQHTLPHQRYLLELDEKGVLQTITAETNLTTLERCNSARLRDVALWSSRFKKIDSTTLHINEKLTTLTIPGFEGVAMCVTYQREGQIRHRYLLRYKKTRDYVSN